MTTVAEYLKQIDRLDDIAKELGFILEAEPDEDGNEPKTKDGMSRTAAWKVGYPLWYAQAREVIKFLLPDRLEEFDHYYLADPKRKNMTIDNYTIQDFLLSRSTFAINDYGTVNIIKWKFLAQMQLLAAAKLKLNNVVMNFRKMTLSDMFDSELDGARELLKSGFLRSAGVIARVVLEKHLADICQAHKVTVKKRGKKPPDLANFNDSLKEAGVFDTPQWRNIQRLGDISNYCCHKKEREPTEEEVLELIEETDKTIKTVF